ncbi:siderophore-interacting protein [Pseudomonas sp. microsymbiont 2]
MLEFRKKLKYNLEVTDVRDVTPLVRRVTLKGDLFAGESPCEPGQWLKLFLPSGASQVSRAYTIRRHYPKSARVEVDFVRHDHGPAGRWVERTWVGEQIGCSALRGGFQRQEDAEWMVLTADETGTPAVMSILESLSPRDRALVVLEAASQTERQAVDSLATVNCKWYFRDDYLGYRNLLLDGISNLTLPSGIGQFWIAGEAKAVNEVRDYLTETCSIQRRLVRGKGYWMRNVADYRD